MSTASPGQVSPIDGMIWGGRRPLPVMFDGQPIKFRIPYTMPGELMIDITSNPPPTSLQFPDSVFSHQIDKPFEIHRMIPRVTAMTTVEPDVGPPVDGVIVPQSVPNGFERVVRLQITDLSKNEKMTKAAAPMEIMTYADARVWEFEDPYTIVRSEGFQVQCDILRFFPQPVVINEQDTTKLKVDIAWQGYLIVIAPPSESR